MAPGDVKLRGFLSNTRQQFLPIRVKHRNKWVTKCVYPGCTKRKSVLGELQPQRLETTYSQIYVHAMRFHKAGLAGADIEKLTKKEVDIELPTGAKDIAIKDNTEKTDEKPPTPRSSTSAKKTKTSQALKALMPLNDWKVLM